jgi:hypothetical protein
MAHMETILILDFDPLQTNTTQLLKKTSARPFWQNQDQDQADITHFGWSHNPRSLPQK